MAPRGNDPLSSRFQRDANPSQLESHGGTKQIRTVGAFRLASLATKWFGPLTHRSKKWRKWRDSNSQRRYPRRFSRPLPNQLGHTSVGFELIARSLKVIKRLDSVDNLHCGLKERFNHRSFLVYERRFIQSCFGHARCPNPLH